MFFDVTGSLGVVLFLLAYALLQAEKIKAESIVYSLMNLLGALGILISLTKDWNLPSFVLEAAWALISIYGLVKAVKRRKTPME